MVVRTVPFIRQIEPAPVAVFSRRMSSLPSPLKSATPTNDQPVPTAPSEIVLIGVKPFIVQMEPWPVTVFCQRMSGRDRQ